jgi:transcriptional regulator with XRE-family HTH domain
MTDMLMRLGWSQRYFALRVGVDENTVGRWCSGKPNPVAMEYLRFCCHIMGV